MFTSKLIDKTSYTYSHVMSLRHKHDFSNFRSLRERILAAKVGVSSKSGLFFAFFVVNHRPWASLSLQNGQSNLLKEPSGMSFGSFGIILQKKSFGVKYLVIFQIALNCSINDKIPTAWYVFWNFRTSKNSTELKFCQKVGKAKDL